MTPAEQTALMKLVREMRQAQREYFAQRTPAALDVSKRLERAVDRMLAELASGERQAGLFEERE